MGKKKIANALIRVDHLLLINKYWNLQISVVYHNRLFLLTQKFIDGVCYVAFLLTIQELRILVYCGSIIL